MVVDSESESRERGVVEEESCLDVDSESSVELELESGEEGGVCMGSQCCESKERGILIVTGGLLGEGKGERGRRRGRSITESLFGLENFVSLRIFCTSAVGGAVCLLLEGICFLFLSDGFEDAFSVLFFCFAFCARLCPSRVLISPLLTVAKSWRRRMMLELINCLYRNAFK